MIKRDNRLIKYDAVILSGATHNQLIIGIFNIVNIIFVIVFLFSFLSLFPKAYSKVIQRIVRTFKIIHKHRLSYLLLLPTMILLIIFNYYPAVSGLFLAFMDYKPGIHMRWIGLQNFAEMFSNPYFWTGVGNMFLFLVTDMLKALIPPIIFAELILAMKSKGAQYWTRVALYLPGILPGIAGLMVWTTGILGETGVVNSILRAVGLGSLARPWLGLESTAIWALIFIGFPWVGSYIIFYGALISVPTSLFDASTIDGCGWWRRIISIDIPMISPQIKYVFVTAFIASIQDFGRVYITTAGGPGHSTYTPMLELFYNMSKFQKYGVAAAMGLFLFVVIFGATLMNLKIQTADNSI